jgi:hypothetical protein
VCTEGEAQRARERAEKRGETDLTKYLSGWTDQEVINKMKEMLKPPRVAAGLKMWARRVFDADSQTLVL